MSPKSKTRLKRPIHPGVFLSEEFLKPLAMSARKLAEALDVPPNRVSAIVAGDRDVTPDTALRLARALGTTPEFWLHLQQAYDLGVAEKTVDLGAVRRVLSKARRNHPGQP